MLLVDGRPCVLVDAGGGCFERLGRAGVTASELDLVLLTHTHVDHSGGLAPVVFSAFMEGRTDALTVTGPVGRDDQPGCTRFIDLLLGPQGAWSYLHTFEGFAITPVEVSSDPDDTGTTTVLERGGLRVSAVAVPHGMMPAVAYRLDLGGHSIVFSGDVQTEHPPLARLAEGCDVLVCDLALPERDTKHGHLHAKPSQVGRMARDSRCRTLVVTHVMPELENELPAALDGVRSAYAGELILAEDLLRVPVYG